MTIRRRSVLRAPKVNDCYSRLFLESLEARRLLAADLEPDAFIGVDVSVDASISSMIGDESSGRHDVDLYKVNLSAGETLDVGVDNALLTPPARFAMLESPYITQLESTASVPGATTADQSVVVSAQVDYPQSVGAMRAYILWGDGAATDADVSITDGKGTISGEHVYPVGGIYEVQLVVLDESGASIKETTTSTITGIGLLDGVLSIVGDANENIIDVSANGSMLEVRADFIDGVHSFPADDVDRILIDSFGGDDRINSIVNDLTSVTQPMVIDSGGGADTIYTAGGNDTVFSGADADVIWLGDGDNIVRAGGGDDFVVGGAGNDQIHGESGQDTLIGRGGNDQLKGQGGSDRLYGGAGDDDLYGGRGDDSIEPGTGDDYVSADGDGTEAWTMNVRILDVDGHEAAAASGEKVDLQVQASVPTVYFIEITSGAEPTLRTGASPRGNLMGGFLLDLAVTRPEIVLAGFADGAEGEGQGAPVLVTFAANQVSGDRWSFSGTLTHADPATVRVYFGGFMTGHDVLAKSDGTYYYEHTLGLFDQGLVTAQAEDQNAQQSDVLDDYV